MHGYRAVSAHSERGARVRAALSRCVAERYTPPAVLPATATVPPGAWTTWPLVGDAVLCVVLGGCARMRARAHHTLGSMRG